MAVESKRPVVGSFTGRGSVTISLPVTISRGTVEKLYRGQSLLSGSRRRSLEGGAERGFLGAVANGSGA